LEYLPRVGGELVVDDNLKQTTEYKKWLVNKKLSE